MPVEDQSSAFRQVSDAFAKVGNTLGVWAAEAAHREGTEAGNEAGLDPEFQLKPNDSVRDRAFNQAGARTARTQTETRIIEGLAELAEANPNDVQAFEAGAEALKSEYIDKLPSDLKPDLLQTFARQKLPYGRNYARLEQRRMADQALADALPAIDARQKSVGQIAYASGLDDAAAAAIEGELGALAATLAEYGPKTEFAIGDRVFEADPNRAGVLDASEIQQRLLGAGEAVAINRVKGTFDRLETPADRQQFADNFKQDFEKKGDVTSVMDLRTVEQLETYMGQAIREDERAARAAEVERNAAMREQRAVLRARIGDYKSFARNGLLPDQEEMSVLRQQAAQIGDDDLIAELNQVEESASIVNMALKRNPAELEIELRNARAAAGDGVSAEDGERILALQMGLARVREGLAKDPVGFAVGAGVVPEIPLDIGGETMELSLIARARRAELVEARYGVTAGLFDKAESDRLSEIENREPGQLAGIASAIVDAAGSDARKYLSELSSDAPKLAQLGAILDAGGSERAVRDAGIGAQLRKDNPGVAKGFTAGDSQTVVRKLLAPLSALPQDQALIQRTAEDIYIGRVGLNQPYDDGAMRQALQEAMGATFVGPGRVQFGGTATLNPPGWWNKESHAIVVPSWLRADRADDVFNSLSIEDFELAGGGRPRGLDGEPLSEDYLRTGSYVTIGEGRYALQLGESDGRPMFALGDGPRGIYELDLEQLRDRIAARQPEAVMP
jgi:hypothetical protein